MQSVPVLLDYAGNCWRCSLYVVKWCD